MLFVIANSANRYGNYSQLQPSAPGLQLVRRGGAVDVADAQRGEQADARLSPDALLDSGVVIGSMPKDALQELSMTERMTGGQAVTRTLARFGVDTVFGLPGIQLDPLYDALYQQRQSIRTYHTRHEQGAAYMALGYAQALGKVGVFAVVSGPGILNATAALATAAGSNVPVLGLTGQIPSSQIGLGLGIPHELRDQEAALRGVVSWVELAKTPAQAPGLLGDAFRAMLGGRHQPAVFEMAPDVLARSEEVALPESFVQPPRPAPDPEAVHAAAKLLASARCPAGSGP